MIDATNPTRLLISVRNVSEALLARSAGVDLLDVKEPLKGSLGAADQIVWCEVLQSAARELPLSAALGELLECQSTELPSGFEFAKFGLSGCRRVRNWPQRWEAAIAELPTGTSPVAVAYADEELAEAPHWREIVEVGGALGCRAALVDTFDKSAGALLDHWQENDVAMFVKCAQDRGMMAVLAGSLSAACIRRLLPLHPDVIAVRGAACRGSRRDALDSSRVQQLCRLVQGKASVGDHH